MKQYCILITTVTGRKIEIPYETSRELAIAELEEMWSSFQGGSRGFRFSYTEDDLIVNLDQVVTIELEEKE